MLSAIAHVDSYYAPRPRDLADLRGDKRLALAGLSRPQSLGIVAGDIVEGYVEAAGLDELVDLYLLEEVQREDDANVILHVVPDDVAIKRRNFWRDAAALLPLLLAADLAEHRRPREQARAADLVADMYKPSDRGMTGPSPLPAMTGGQAASWHALMDLHDRLPDHWTLVGGQMVHLHCAEHGVSPERPTEDCPIRSDVRAAPDMLAHFTGALADLGFKPDTSGEGLQHRWRRWGLTERRSM